VARDLLALGLVKAVTAVASVVTQYSHQLVPQALTLPTWNDLQEATEEITSQGSCCWPVKPKFREFWNPLRMRSYRRWRKDASCS